MHRLTGTVGSLVGKARRVIRRGPSAEERRQSFLREFGQYPPDHEASKSARELFAREVVRPVLAQRAQAVQQVIPEAVTKNAQGYLMVNNDPIIWTMLNAIKEQQKEIVELKRQIRQLRRKRR